MEVSEYPKRLCIYPIPCVCMRVMSICSSVRISLLRAVAKWKNPGLWLIVLHSEMSAASRHLRLFASCMFLMMQACCRLKLWSYVFLCPTSEFRWLFSLRSLRCSYNLCLSDLDVSPM